MNVIAIQQVYVEYHGQAAHAAAFPHKGRNALDAAVLGYMNVAALRQHIRPDERIHGIFTDAGDKPNIVPEPRRGRLVRALADAAPRSSALKERVLRCLRGRGRRPPGCTMDHEWQDPAYADMRRQPGRSIDLYGANADRARPAPWPTRPDAAGVVGSTDMGNVSYVVPSHPPDDRGRPARTSSIHTPEFAAYARGAEGDRRRARRRQGDGHDGRRPVAGSEPGRGRQSRVRRGRRDPALTASGDPGEHGERSPVRAR